MNLKERVAMLVKQNPTMVVHSDQINPDDVVIALEQSPEQSNGEAKPLANLAEDYQKHLETVAREELHTSPRETVLQMLVDKKMDEHFTFKTTRKQGDNYVQAMRQVLSRTRKKALRQKRVLDEFKMLVISIKVKENYDEVTLVRTKTLSAHQESVYDEIMKAAAKVQITSK